LAAFHRYALARWPALTRFLDDGRIELDNNTVERKTICSPDPTAARPARPSSLRCYRVEHNMGAGLGPMLYDETDYAAAAQYAPGSSHGRSAPTLPGASTLNRRKLRDELFNEGRIVL
jgi:hypothetical protein